jgi:ATP phosphoribosyltransferase
MAGIKYVSGSVEAACGLGLADAVVDLVETGTTMKAAGLEVVSDICQSQSLLIVNKNTQHRPLMDLIIRRIQVRIETACVFTAILVHTARASINSVQCVALASLLQ